MNHPKIVSLKEILYNITSDPIVFTNGCFDMFHAGHAHMLKSIKRSAPLDAKLVVGINSDESVRANKGPHRPIICEEQRAYLVACHESVDSVSLAQTSYSEILDPQIKFVLRETIYNYSFQIPS